MTTLLFYSVVMRVIVTMFSGSAAPSQLNTVLLSHDELFTIGLFVVRFFASSLAVKNGSGLLPL